MSVIQEVTTTLFIAVTKVVIEDKDVTVYLEVQTSNNQVLCTHEVDMALEGETGQTGSSNTFGLDSLVRRAILLAESELGL